MRNPDIEATIIIIASMLEKGSIQYTFMPGRVNLGNNVRGNHRKSLKVDKGRANWIQVPRNREKI